MQQTASPARDTAPSASTAAHGRAHRDRAAYHYLVFTLSQELPAPPDNRPETLARRNALALSMVEDLDPSGTAETALAVRFAAADMAAADSLCLAQRPDTADEKRAQCLAWANSMMRQSTAALKALVALRDSRDRRARNAANGGASGWGSYVAMQYMTEALAEIAPEASLDIIPTAQPAEPPHEPAATPHPGPSATAPGDAMAPDDDEDDDLVPLPDSAHDYAIRYPERVALIRRHGGIPAKPGFTPPDAAIVWALLTSRSPMLRAIDRADASCFDTTSRDLSF